MSGSSIGVIVPCYNYARYLPQCVKSIVDQSFSNLQILIIDDASSDDTKAVGERLAASDGRIEFRHHLSNRGNIATYNEGIEWASTDYLLLLSADDWLIPGALARAASVLDAHEDVVLTYGNALVAEDTRPFPEIQPQGDTCQYKIIQGQSFIERACDKAAYAPLCTPTAIVRTNAQKEVEGYSAALPHAGDLEMRIRLACRGNVANLNAYQAIYRKHSSNMHYSFLEIKNAQQHLLAFDSAFTKDHDRIADSSRLRRRYRKAIARHVIHCANGAITLRDHVKYREYMAFAENTFPPIIATRTWATSRLMQILGARAVGALKSMMKLVKSPLKKILAKTV